MTQIARRLPPRLRARGFSLIESLIAASIAGVLAASTLPRFADALQQQRLTATTNELLLAVNLARAEATARRTRIAVVPRVASDWASGWRVFIDHNGDGRLDADEPVVREFAELPRGLSVEPKFGGYDGHALAFDPAGHLRRPGSGGMLLGRMVLRLGEKARALCFSAAAVRTVRAAACA